MICSEWLSLFILGQFFSLFNDFLSQSSLIVLFTAPILFLCHYNLITYHKYIFYYLAFIWGAHHNAPSPIKKTEQVFIKKKNFLSYGNSPLLVSNNNKVFYARGYGEESKTGLIYKTRTKNILRKNNAIFKAKTGPNKKSSVKDIYNHLNRKAKKQISHLPTIVNQWAQSIYIGGRQLLPERIKTAFIQTGLFHLLVVSGIHITMAATIAEFFILLPFKLLYIIRIITPFYWRHLIVTSKVFTCCILILYTFMIGFPSSAQRALCLYIVAQIMSHTVVHFNIKKCILISASLQSLLFPIGFLDISTLMSWSAYIIILSKKTSQKISTAITTTLLKQLALGLIIAGFIGNLSVIGIAINIIMVPIFSYIFCSGVLFFIHEHIPVFILNTVIYLHFFFIKIICYLSSFCLKFHFLFIDLKPYYLWKIRFILFLLGVIMILKMWNFLGTNKNQP